MDGNNSRLTQGRAGKREMGEGGEGCQVDIMRLRHAPFQLLELLHPHVSKQRCCNHVRSVKNKPWHFLFSPSCLFSLSHSFCIHYHYEDFIMKIFLKALKKKIITSIWQKRTQKIGWDRKGQNICIQHINKRL